MGDERSTPESNTDERSQPLEGAAGPSRDRRRKSPVRAEKLPIAVTLRRDR